MRKFLVINFCILANLVCGSCSELDFSQFPGYNELFGDTGDSKVEVVKRRPAENLAAQGGVSSPEKASSTNTQLSSSGSADGKTLTGKGDPNDTSPPDFRSTFTTLNPINTEEESLYPGRYVSGKTPASPYLPAAPEREISPNAGPPAALLPAPPVPPLPFLPAQNQLGNQMASLQGQAPITAAPPLPYERRKPVLNEQSKMQLQLLSSENLPPSDQQSPPLSSVPPKQDYEAKKAELTTQMQDLIAERERIAEQQRYYNDPVNVIHPNQRLRPDESVQPITIIQPPVTQNPVPYPTPAVNTAPVPGPMQSAPAPKPVILNDEAPPRLSSRIEERDIAPATASDADKFPSALPALPAKEPEPMPAPTPMMPPSPPAAAPAPRNDKETFAPVMTPSFPDSTRYLDAPRYIDRYQ